MSHSEQLGLHNLSLHGLNDPQKQAVLNTEGPVLILAGAGSGKTRTLTYRIGHLICNLKVAPESICAVSFTNKSASEMKNRVRTLLKQTLGKLPKKKPLLCTFHALGLTILREHIEKLNMDKQFSLYDSADQIGVLRECLTGLRDERNYDKKRLMGRISYLKNRGISPSDFVQSSVFDEDDPYDIMTAHLYPLYQEKLHFYNAMDFDDILFLSVELFKKYPDLAQEYGKRFGHIMVDEYQDTNALQFSLIQYLTKTHQNLCVVGDDDQSIYSFRGANVENILNFERYYPKTKVIKLEENYRSTPEILKLANEVIRHNTKRKKKTLFTRTGPGSAPLLWITQDEEHEAAIVAEDITRRMTEGRPLSEIAILYRSNTQMPFFEDQMRLAQIPYRVVGGQKLYERKEIKDIIGYLALLTNPKDSLALRRILNVPARGIGKATLQKCLDAAGGAPLFPFMQKSGTVGGPKVAKFCELLDKHRRLFSVLPLPKALEGLLEDLKFENHIKKHYESLKEQGRRLRDIEQFQQSAERFCKTYGSENALGPFVKKLLLVDSQDRARSAIGSQGPTNEVTLMTLHSSKGLEFDVVYFAGIEEEKIPHHRSIKADQDLSEERRLAYVGVTRARQELILTRTKEKKSHHKKVPGLSLAFFRLLMGNLPLFRTGHVLGI